MKLLLENWREYLSEAARTYTDLADGVKIAIKKPQEGTISISYVDDKGNDIWEEDTDGNDIPHGKVTIINDADAGACDEAWHVYGSGAKTGWGPLLYDIAIEYASLNGEGLIADRREVSPEAKKIWDYYLSKRKDVQAHQLDASCNQKVAGDSFETSSLSKRYTKPPTSIKQLQKLGKIIQ